MSSVPSLGDVETGGTPGLRTEGPEAPAPLASFVRPLVLAVSLLLLCRDVAAPFNGWHEFNSAMYSQFARNHLQYGFAYTAFYCTWGDTLDAPETPQRYLNHPPLIALWTAASLLVFGDHEWAGRLVPIAATVGSTALLMTIFSRLGGSLFGALAGFFFATLPIVAYFGRMIDHVAPVQFFSLLMVHGYLEWTGLYDGRARPRRGALCYGAGCVLGIGTGWAALLPAGLLGAWHSVRVARRTGEARLLGWLVALPALSFGAVVAHIAAGCGWDFGMLRELFAGRSMGGEGGRQPWSAWLALQGVHFLRNFTWPGAVAATLSVLFLAVPLLRRTTRGAALRSPLVGSLAVVVTLTGLHGLLYVVLFKNESWFHDYWQFFLAPFVAASLAALVVTAHDALAPLAPRPWPLALSLMLLAPMPWAAASLDFYAAGRQIDPRQVEALVKLGQLVPRRAPVWTSRQWPISSETIGGYTNRWPNATVAYYADRPLLFSRDIREIEANAPRGVAYLLERSAKPWSRDLEVALARSFPSVSVGDHHVIFLLDRAR
jgi:4-amino-4-deoxy-L-arabinose transferase-like glycosyltransferase